MSSGDKQRVLESLLCIQRAKELDEMIVSGKDQKMTFVMTKVLTKVFNVI